MKVSSPIGELPFDPQKVRISDGGVRVEGVMGAWPAQVTITASDLPSLLRLALPALYAAGGTALVLALARRARSHRRL
jgi:hypothetical protein